MKIILIWSILWSTLCAGCTVASPFMKLKFRLCVLNQYTQTIHQSGIDSDIACTMICDRDPLCKGTRFDPANSQCILYADTPSNIYTEEEATCHKEVEAYFKNKPAHNVCSSDFIHSDPSVPYTRYWLGSTTVLSDNAEPECDNVGGKLVQISTAEEWQYVKSLAQTKGNYVWIGLKLISGALRNRDNFYWYQSNDTNTDHVVWYGTQPDGIGGGENVIINHGFGYTADDAPPSTRSYTICECSTIY